MLYRAEALGLAGSVTAIFRELIHQRLGLFYEPAQFDQVADRLAPLVVARGMGSFMDYYYYLKYSDAADEWSRVADALAVQETYFWREIDQLRAVVDHVVPRLLTSSHTGALRLWSIPCASGEEPLSLAMLLNEAGWFDRARIEIVGSDASPAAVARAREGVYRPRSFRNLPVPLRDKYFSPAGDGWRVNRDLHGRVSYDVVNLMNEREVLRHASAPIVLCRNVFIYFSDASIRRALAVFERAMPVPGYFCVGASESILRRSAAFELHEIGGAFVYVKERDADARDATLSTVGRAS